jgi:hypothetical protein
MFAFRPSTREHPVSHRSSLGLLLVLLVACGGNPAPSVSGGPATSAEGAVRSFLQAVSDSNLAKMALYWGSAKGAAAKTHEPPDYERRMVVMQSYLRRASYRVVSGVTEGPVDSRQLQVELDRGECKRLVPFTAIKAGDGTWIVNQVDLASAGSPTKPCSGKAPKDSTMPKDSAQ